MKRLVITMTICLMLVMSAGCVTTTDPVTGEKLYSLDPNAVAKIEPVIETAITVGGMLAPLFPFLIPVIALAGGIFGTWKKIKPQVVKAQNRATLMHTGVSSLVVAIEALKKVSPESWEKLKDKIKVGPEIENIIRAIRGLPAKT